MSQVNGSIDEVDRNLRGAFTDDAPRMERKFEGCYDDRLGQVDDKLQVLSTQIEEISNRPILTSSPEPTLAAVLGPSNVALASSPKLI